MSELIARASGEIRARDTLLGYWWYEKSEADKVIAEKDAEIERLEILCANYRHDCDNLAISNEQAKRAARTLLKKMNNNKYKRCLAMASWCASRSASLCSDPADDELHKSDFYDKWKLRWMELAKKISSGSDR